MILMENMSGIERVEILKCLYQEEIFHIFTIHSLEDNHVKACYVDKENQQIKSILSISDEANCLYTTFWARDKSELQIIANELQTLKNRRILLAGKRDEVQEILQHMRIQKEVSSDICYVHSGENVITTYENRFRKAKVNEYDIYHVGRFYEGFFQPDTKAELEKVTNRQKIEGDIHKGLYFIMEDDVPIGMGRYGSFTENYIELTTMYVKMEFRRKGYGEMLLNGLIQNCLAEGKRPVLQTSIYNRQARSLYEKVGFSQVGEYSFEYVW